MVKQTWFNSNNKLEPVISLSYLILILLPGVWLYGSFGMFRNGKDYPAWLHQYQHQLVSVCSLAMPRRS